MRYQARPLPSDRDRRAIRIGNSIQTTPLAPRKSRRGDLVLRYRYGADSWHAQLGGVFRSVGGYTTDPSAERHVLATGFSLSGTTQFFGKDYVMAQGNFGHGMGVTCWTRRASRRTSA